MKRWLLLLLGIVLILLGLAVSAGGAVMLSMFGSDQSVSTPAATVKATGAALLIENIRIDASNLPIPSTVGTLHLSAHSPTGRSLFLGSAAASDVDTFLTGAPYDVVVDLTSGGVVRTRQVPGSQTPPPPNSQSIWHEQSSGPRASIPTVTGNHDTSVVMNEDGTAGIEANIVVSLDVPGIWRAGWIAVGLGALSILLGGVAIWRSTVARKHGKHAAAHQHAQSDAESQLHEPADVQEPAPEHAHSHALGHVEAVAVPVAIIEPAAEVAAAPVVEPAAEVALAPVVEPVTPAVAVPATDPSLIPPWTHVEVLVAPMTDQSAADPTTTSSEALSSEALSQAVVAGTELTAESLDVPVWESQDWIATPARVEPTPDGAPERE